MWQPNRHYTSNYDCGYSEIFQRSTVEFCLEYEMAWKRKMVSLPPRKLFSIHVVHIPTYIHTLCVLAISQHFACTNYPIMKISDKERAKKSTMRISNY